MAKHDTSLAVPTPPVLCVYQLKITLRYIKPPIWRRVLVPDNYRLGQLHDVIVAAMGWGGYHMHDFSFGGGFRQTQYAHANLVRELGMRIHDENMFFLTQLFVRKGQCFNYQYDFGDGWMHQVKVEKALPFDPAVRLPVCLAGARACPPEDCGGVPGYFKVLQALREASTPEDRELRDWVGGYNSEDFDIGRVNRRLGSR
jgi:hypothetical protein